MDVATAASAADTRAAGELFAILLNHAIEGQTDASAREQAIESLAADARPEARQEIDSILPLEGTRMVPGSRSWIRSTLRSGVLTVRLVELIEVPAVGSPGQPFRPWCDNKLVVTRIGGQWRLIDFQRAIASEKAKFSPSTWSGVMNSGKGWRRFEVS